MYKDKWVVLLGYKVRSTMMPHQLPCHGYPWRKCPSQRPRASRWRLKIRHGGQVANYDSIYMMDFVSVMHTHPWWFSTILWRLKLSWINRFCVVLVERGAQWFISPTAAPLSSSSPLQAYGPNCHCYACGPTGPPAGLNPGPWMGF